MDSKAKWLNFGLLGLTLIVPIIFVNFDNISSINGTISLWLVTMTLAIAFVILYKYR